MSHRHLLFALLEANPRADGDSDPLDGYPDGPVSGDADADRVDSFHVHLPKLQYMGYVDWGRETGRVFRGPNWAEVAPMLELLRNHREVPGNLFCAPLVELVASVPRRRGRSGPFTTVVPSARGVGPDPTAGSTRSRGPGSHPSRPSRRVRAGETGS